MCDAVPCGSRPVVTSHWSYVGDGNGGYRKVDQYSYVGEGRGSYDPFAVEDDEKEDPPSECLRASFFCLLCALALLGAAALGVSVLGVHYDDLKGGPLGGVLSGIDILAPDQEFEAQHIPANDTGANAAVVARGPATLVATTAPPGRDAEPATTEPLAAAATPSPPAPPPPPPPPADGSSEGRGAPERYDCSSYAGHRASYAGAGTGAAEVEARRAQLVSTARRPWRRGDGQASTFAREAALVTSAAAGATPGAAEKVLLRAQRRLGEAADCGGEAGLAAVGAAGLAGAAWDMLDQDHDGRISPQELGVSRHQGRLSGSAFDVLLGADADGNSALDIPEFTFTLLQAVLGNQSLGGSLDVPGEALVDAAWLLADADGDGRVGREELAELGRELNLTYAGLGPMLAPAGASGALENSAQFQSSVAKACAVAGTSTLVQAARVSRALAKVGCSAPVLRACWASCSAAQGAQAAPGGARAKPEGARKHQPHRAKRRPAARPDKAPAAPHEDAAQRAWCCEHEHVGCSVAPGVSEAAPAGHPKASAGHGAGEEAEAEAEADAEAPSPKATEESSATGTSTTSLPYDCRSGYANWAQAWSLGKADWCCRHFSRGCPSTTTETETTTRAATTTTRAAAAHTSSSASASAAKSGHQRHRKGGGKGGVKPLGPSYDCSAGGSGWVAEWSLARKKWCCENEKVGCRIHPASSSTTKALRPTSTSAAPTQTSTAPTETSTATTKDPAATAEDKYALTFYATGCCTTERTAATAWWETQREDIVLADMFVLCQHTAAGTASKEHREICGCGSRTPVCEQQEKFIEPGAREQEEPLPSSYNCSAGRGSWATGWSRGKKEWCCSAQGFGCDASEGPAHGSAAATRFDCRDRLQEWATAWSAPKKNWCCQEKGLGCTG